MTSGSQQVLVLDSKACLELLRGGGLGRVAITERGLPNVLPVAFELRGSDIVFAADYDSLLARATNGTVVAFQSDGERSDGIWSVSAVGLAAHLTAGELAILGPISLPRWSVSAPDHIVRIRPELISGQQWHAKPRCRRLEHTDLPTAAIAASPG
jgi:hypothetical protein